MSQYKIAPSILAADYANFEREIKRLEASQGGDWFVGSVRCSYLCGFGRNGWNLNHL